MGYQFDPLPDARSTATGTALPFETEFDGDRRPQGPAQADPCDPGRYWDFFSGTD